MTDKIRLRGMTWEHPRGYDCLVAASERYAKETGVEITWRKRSLQAFADEPILNIAKENDLIVLDHPHVGQIAEGGALVALPDMESGAEMSMGGSVESYIYQGATWAYPVDAACQMAVRRPDIDVPRAQYWEDFLASDAAKYRVITPLLPVDAFDMLMTLVAGREEVDLPVSDDAFISEKNGIPALEILKALFRLGPSDACKLNPIGVLELMSTENEFAASPCLFGYINYARPDFRRYALQYEDLPLFQGFSHRRGILGGAGIGVSSLSDNTEAARAFAAWVASEPVQSGVYIENEGQPAHRGTWQKLRANSSYAGFFNGAFDTMSSAWTRPRDEWFLHYVDDVCEVMSDFFIQDIPSDRFLAELNSLYRNAKARG